MDTKNPGPAHDAVDAITDQWAAVRPDLETAPMAVFGRIYRLAGAMRGKVDKAYAPYGLGLGEFDVLATLRRSGEPYTLSPRELTATLMITTGGMTGRLDKLERAGLLTRSPDPNDRRGLRVTLSERGGELVDLAVSAGLAEQRTALENALTDEEAAQLSGLLRKLLATSA
ncbi:MULTISPECIES: MarR family winged helix-turn-helix transcriptional regulator [unclassified Streptomyces]|uniref:MarR family winged helix-turn-helix transcriptional regulator n=1 Tax=unclassified Streptomyces TaxID=2593676 RepID=UPI0016601F3E|nr:MULTISPECIES: MarR family transcriptional regulator [unclassified Streptomyces]MBD0709703.1 MarR family transcriptional regulator [Streptomyces sp. CBMA291]MBD0715332.1 MarR family transcriptional regulator [Streptomyces sp. CBMA370]